MKFKERKVIENIKKVFTSKWLFLCSMFLFVSCPGLLQAPPATPGSNIPITLNPTPSPQLPNNLNPNNNQDTDNLTLPKDREWGIATCYKDQTLNTEEFNKRLKLFLSASINPNKMNWWVRCDFKTKEYKEWKGGVYLKGTVSFERGAFNPQDQSQSLKPKEGDIEIHILDSNGNIIRPNPQNLKNEYIRMRIVPSLSSITGTNVNLVFKDTKGQITLNGPVKWNEKRQEYVISGDLSFTNYTSFNGLGQFYKGQIGYFGIPACSFLTCSNFLSQPDAL